MSDTTYDERIIQALQEADYGLTQRKLSEEVDAARVTIRKYCEDLLEDGEIAVIEKAGSLIYFIPDEGGASA